MPSLGNLFVTLIFLAALGCGDATRYVPHPAPTVRRFSGKFASSLALLGSRGVTVNGIVGEGQVTSEGGFEIDVLTEPRPQILFILHENKVWAPLYVATPEADTVFSAREIALGFIALNPWVFVVPSPDRKILIEAAGRHRDFAVLEQSIEAMLRSGIAEEFDGAAHADVMGKAMRIGLELLAAGRTASSGEGLLPARLIQYPLAPSQVVFGDPDSLYLEAGAGDRIEIVNPTAIFYGFELDGETQSVLQGRDSFLSLSLQWPPVVATPPTRREIELDGPTVIDAYKGFDFSSAESLQVTTSRGKATYANFLKGACKLIDAFAWCPLQDQTITLAVESLDPSSETGSGLAASFSLLRDIANWRDALTWFFNTLADNEVWDFVADIIWKEWPSETTVSYLSGARVAVSAASDALNVLRLVDAANEALPFFYDLATSPAALHFCISQRDGGFLEDCRSADPSPCFTISPRHPRPDEIVGFDASCSLTEFTDESSFDWDLDGDGIFEIVDGSHAVRHRYPTEGLRTAALRLTAKSGRSTSLEKTVLVYEQSVDPDCTRECSSPACALFCSEPEPPPPPEDVSCEVYCEVIARCLDEVLAPDPTNYTSCLADCEFRMPSAECRRRTLELGCAPPLGCPD